MQPWASRPTSSWAYLKKNKQTKKAFKKFNLDRYLAHVQSLLLLFQVGAMLKKRASVSQLHQPWLTINPNLKASKLITQCHSLRVALYVKVCSNVLQVNVIFPIWRDVCVFITHQLNQVPVSLSYGHLALQTSSIGFPWEPHSSVQLASMSFSVVVQCEQVNIYGFCWWVKPNSIYQSLLSTRILFNVVLCVFTHVPFCSNLA